jgi:tetratricopeptide (TPR) repeat protein
MQNPKRIMRDEQGREMKMPKVTSSLIKYNIHNAPALYNLGTFELQQGDPHKALDCLKASWNAEPVKETLINLSTAYKLIGNIPVAKKKLNECIERYPDFPLPYNNLGLIKFDECAYEDAYKLYRKALELDPKYADAHWNYALLTGLDMFGGLTEYHPENFVDEYDWRFQKSNPVQISKTIGTPRWNGEPLEGKKLMILCEQGLGDMIQFLRYAYAFPPEQVIIHYPEHLYSIVDPKYTVTNLSTVEHDYWIPMCSILKYVDIGDGKPYISAGTKVMESDGRPKIGIVWKGSAKHQNDKNRSMTVRDFYWLFKYGKVYSLQKDVELPKSIKDIHKLKLDTWLDTAQYVNAMDVVVTVDTSVAHMAGALGKRVFTLIPEFGIDWRWGRDNEKCRWYDSMTLVRKRDMKRCEELVSDYLSSL